MITEHDLKEAIVECQGVREPNANTCIKLAAYYTILDHIQEQTTTPTYSYAPPPSISSSYISYDGESDFAKKIDGMDSYKMLDVMDELMETLCILNPNLYNSVMRKLSE